MLAETKLTPIAVQCLAKLVSGGKEISRIELIDGLSCGISCIKSAIRRLTNNHCITVDVRGRLAYFTATNAACEILEKAREPKILVINKTRRERERENARKAKQQAAKAKELADADLARRWVPPRTINLFAQPEYAPDQRVYYRNDGNVGIKSKGLGC